MDSRDATQSYELHNPIATASVEQDEAQELGTLTLRHRSNATVPPEPESLDSQPVSDETEGLPKFYSDLTTIRSYISSIWAVVTFSWSNMFLVFVPIGWTCYSLAPKAVVVIAITNFIAVASLSNLLLFSSDQLALQLGGAPAAIIYEFQKNVLEIIFAVIALKECDLQTLQAVLMGAVINNLLIIGICFLSGGFQYLEQGFNLGKVQISCSLLMLGVTIQLLPGVINFATTGTSPLSLYYDPKSGAQMSRLISVVMVVFHRLAASKELEEYADREKPSIRYPRTFSPKRFIDTVFFRKKFDIEERAGEAIEPNNEATDASPSKLNVVVATIVLIGCTVLLVKIIGYLWDALDRLTSGPGHSMSPEFVGVILIPIVSNIAQVFLFVEVINESVHDHLDGVLDDIIGSSIQISLLITPMMVVIGWIMGIPLLLINDPVDSAILFMSVLVLNYVINDGRANWFEGVILITLYTIFALALWYYPGRDLFVVLEEIESLPRVCRFDGGT